MLLCIDRGFCPDALGEVRLGVKSEVEYNDNLFLEESGETSDVMYRVSPWIEMAKTWSRAKTELTYRPRYTWYDKNPTYDSAGHRVELSMYGKPRRDVDLTFENLFNRSEESALDRQALQGATRLPYSTYASSLLGTWTTGRQDSYGFALRGERLDYDKDSTSQDSSEAGGGINARKRVGQQVFLTIDAGYTEGWYDDSTSYQLSRGTLGSEYALTPKKRLFLRLGGSRYTGDARRNYSTLSPLVGLVREFPHGHYDIGAGVIVRSEEGEETTYEPSVVGNAHTTKGWRRGEMTLTVSAGHEEEYIDFDNPGFDTFVSGMVSGWYGIAKDWKGTGRCQLRDDAYLETRPGERDRNDVTFRLKVGIERQLMRRASLSLDYSYNSRWSNIDEYGYEENSVILSLNIYTR
ncbi:hypothetical protein DSLASN_27350 [Desulfoluna limicola]|uniref:TIGR03016 family PEP-CTERM system-associated outer membrane protein n=1 Tax=Desulfoluna limicola TaxID=2810562 RepID=A0ABM7PJ50_9BACT|nr:hypothetical protein [Desulfoluna limicola]BCS97103.1 hypothetical protein DSLASN_27350 [Desulfoluna limicola]